MKKYTFLFLSVLCLISACKKEVPSPESRLFGKWQKVKVEGKNTASNWFDVSLPCMTADILEFHSSGDLVIQEGESACGPGKNIFYGKWRLEPDSSKIIFTQNVTPGEHEWIVDEISETQLKLVSIVNTAGPIYHRNTYEKR